MKKSNVCFRNEPVETIKSF